MPEEELENDGGLDMQTPVPPGWTKLVHEILGPDFECEVAQPDGGGTLFKIIVPKEKSNAPSFHWTQHKRDVRTKELGNTGAKGVKEWCLKVRQNLTRTGTKLVQYP